MWLWHGPLNSLSTCHLSLLDISPYVASVMGHLVVSPLTLSQYCHVYALAFGYSLLTLSRYSGGLTSWA
jgi:hypothetical protein